ncbi:hypothetical protein [Mesonia maritima]|uniref:Uncharacterized protein n=1 Tax=Mesonia maritima TaxID=1793873 RepID=A0ABU1KBY0_9FLAO|nr:hypothetical protein [Mesonia maritima]MDR6301967.1 hypothetical protein [Mesonia maritima]
MKKIFVVIFLTFIAANFTSCREETKTKEVVREVEVEKEAPKVEEEKGILERTGEKIDNEVDKEVNEEIDKIGDDK